MDFFPLSPRKLRVLDSASLLKLNTEKGCVSVRQREKVKRFLDRS